MSSSRSSSRSKKRSTTNLADLRLAPLSTRFVPDNNKRQSSAPRSPYEEAADMTFARHHPTYIQGRSAPTSPGILSRSSSRKHLGGGLSRRGSLYDDDAAPATEVSIVYPASVREEALRAQKTSSGMTKAKSEAALVLGRRHQPRLAGRGVQLSHKRLGPPKSKTATSSTPRIRSRMHLSASGEEDWLSHATATTNALLQESRGQSWLSSQDSPTALALPSSDEDEVDDEGYEELAATAHLSTQHDPVNTSPTSPRAYRWGSRFGSRSASRRTSRRGSFTNLRTPLAAANNEGDTGYFDSYAIDQRDFGSAYIAEESEDDTVAGAADDQKDEAELRHLAQNPAIGFGGLFERIAGMGWFGGDSEDSGVETDLDRAEGSWKATAIPPPPPPPPPPGNDGQQVGVWEDAAWLLSIAGRALT